MRVLVVNPGSSSVKLRLLDGQQVVASRDVEHPLDDSTADALAELGATADAVGHRVVHGGGRSAPAVVDDALLAELGDLVPLAPLHQPASLRAMGLVRWLLPGVPQVACFDTAFHSRIPAAAATYAVPEPWRTRWGLRKHGFHGLSHAYASRRAVELAGAPGRVVSCHLGAGASLCAVVDGRSVDTTMGFTPADGLVMATRAGAVDPGMLLWLLDGRLSPVEVSDGLERYGGLVALCGTGDVREVLAARAGGDPRARLALEVYLHRLCALVAAMAAAAQGIDLLVLTGGVGENAAEVRAEAAEGLGFLGIAVDAGLNLAGSGDRELTAAGATVRTFVVCAREDLEVVRQVTELLG